MSKVLKFSILLSIVINVGCNQNKFDIKVNSEVEIKVHRTDSALFFAPVQSVLNNIEDFYASYPDFADIYFNEILSIGSPSSRYFFDFLSLFLSNPDFRECYDTVQVLFNNFALQKKEIENAFNYLKYYIADIQIPEIYTMISGFNQSIVILDNAVGISLDKFLGSNSMFYKKLHSPTYMHKRYETNLLSVEVVRGWLESEFPNLDPAKNLVNTMIYHGKIMYLIDAAFPKQTDAFKISYLPWEIKWAKNSEKHIWAFFIDKKLLFTTDTKVINRFITDAPYIQDFGTDSPCRIGIWIGWQIVRSYMNKNPEVTIPELINNDDYQSILLQSGYAPK